MQPTFNNPTIGAWDFHENWFSFELKPDKKQSPSWNMIFAAQSRLLASLGSHVAPHGSGGGGWGGGGGDGSGGGGEVVEEDVVEEVMAVVEERSDKNNLEKGKESWRDVCRDGHSSY